MTEYAWGSNTSSHFHPNFGFKMAGVDASDKEFWRLSTFASIGREFDEKKLPVEHQIVDTSSNFPGLPDFFYYNFFYASNSVLSILSDFDLGDTVISPVVMVSPDGKETEKKFSILATRNQKDCLEPSKSKGVYKNESDKYEKSPFQYDDDICFTASALMGPDLFHVDRFDGLYFSDALVQRLKGAGLARYFHLFRVQIVE